MYLWIKKYLNNLYISLELAYALTPIDIMLKIIKIQLNLKAVFLNC